jgi:hypothetical protein
LPPDLPQSIQQNIDVFLFSLSGGDLSKHAQLRKLKLSEASRFLILKFRQSFIDYYALHKDDL